jgi:hypothetical protein
MADTTISSLDTYIDANIYHSGVWDEATDAQRTKALNNCVNLLIALFPDRYTANADIPVDILANQVVWFMRIDDTFLRAEMGATYIQMSGVMVNIKDKDRSIAPYVLAKLGITPDPLTGGLSRRKVGSYSYRTVGTDLSIHRRSDI